MRAALQLILQEQKKTLKVLSWIDMLRANYNYNLADREATYQSRYSIGEYCDLRNKSAACPLTLGLTQLAYFFVGCVTLREYLNVGIRLITSRTNHPL